MSSGSRHGPGWQWAALDSEVSLRSQAILSERPEPQGLGKVWETSHRTGYRVGED